MTDLKERYLAAKRGLFDRYFASLNDAQRSAVYHILDPLLILAGAGSGKTTVLVHRIAYIIRYGNAYHQNEVPADLTEADVASLEQSLSQKLSKSVLEQILSQFISAPAQPWQVLAITFTNKAANEIKSRLAAAFPEDPQCANDIWAGTFHSICMRILRRFATEAGLQPGFTVYDTDDSKKAIKAVLSALNIEEKVLPIKTAQGYISRAKDKLIPPEQFALEMGNDYRMKQIERVYDAYQKRLAASNALDFDDIIVRTVTLLTENPEILHLYQKQFRFVCVDEYQDTNYAQFRLTELLSGGYRNLMVVGDDDQSIYKFRGATIENILQFTNKFHPATLIRLEQNYRSTQSILDAANAVISNNTKSDAMRKVLFTDRGQGKKIRVLNPEHQGAEARAIVDAVQKSVAAGECHYRDFAVLFRANAQSNALESAFARSAVPYRMLGGVRFSDRKEIRDIVAYLQLIENHSDKERLLRIVNEPKRKLGDRTLAAVEEIATERGTSMFEVMKNADQYVALARSAQTLKQFAGLIEELTELSGVMALDDFVDEVLERTGYRQMIRDMGQEEAERLDNLDEFISNVKEYMERAEHPSLLEFLQETTLVADVDRYDDTADAVVLMTIHSAKGLEFPRVFLPGFEEGIFPSMQTVMANPEDLEEERRLAYVAITRAKDELTVLHAKSRLLYGRTTCNPASRFLSEIPDRLLEQPRAEHTYGGYTKENSYAASGTAAYGVTHRVQPTYTGAKDTITVGRVATPKVPTERFEPGDRVRHMIFGEGLVLSATKMAADTLYEIAFDTKGTKKLMATYAKLKKI